jgi:hypothetical protein
MADLRDDLSIARICGGTVMTISIRSVMFSAGMIKFSNVQKLSAVISGPFIVKWV